MMDAAAVTVGGGSCSADQRCSVARAATVHLAVLDS